MRETARHLPDPVGDPDPSTSEPQSHSTTAAQSTADGADTNLSMCSSDFMQDLMVALHDKNPESIGDKCLLPFAETRRIVAISSLVKRLDDESDRYGVRERIISHAMFDSDPEVKARANEILNRTKSETLLLRWRIEVAIQNLGSENPQPLPKLEITNTQAAALLEERGSPHTASLTEGERSLIRRGTLKMLSSSEPQMNLRSMDHRITALDEFGRRTIVLGSIELLRQNLSDPHVQQRLFQTLLHGGELAALRASRILERSNDAAIEGQLERLVLVDKLRPTYALLAACAGTQREELCMILYQRLSDSGLDEKVRAGAAHGLYGQKHDWVFKKLMDVALFDHKTPWPVRVEAAQSLGPLLVDRDTLTERLSHLISKGAWHASWALAVTQPMQQRFSAGSVFQQHVATLFSHYFDRVFNTASLLDEQRIAAGIALHHRNPGKHDEVAMFLQKAAGKSFVFYFPAAQREAAAEALTSEGADVRYKLRGLPNG